MLQRDQVYPPRPCTVRLNRILDSALNFFSASYGRVGYTHGLEIDQPLSVIRIGYGGRGSWNDPFVVVPHANWRDVFDTGSFETGAYERCRTYDPNGEDLDCIALDWPAENTAIYFELVRSSYPRSWMGSLLRLQRDATGELYRRNRYYDPVRGRFTQEDPIGLAGGINLYGFANGDPVNFSDPFGLSGCPKGQMQTRDGECVPLLTGTPPFITPGPLGLGGAAVRGARFVQALFRTGGSLSIATAAARMPSQFALAARVAESTGGSLSLTEGAGFAVKIPHGSRNIVLRVMAEGGGRQNYWRLSVSGKGAFTREGLTSSDKALTHIDVTRESFDDILRVIQQIRSPR